MSGLRLAQFGNLRLRRCLFWAIDFYFELKQLKSVGIGLALIGAIKCNILVLSQDFVVGFTTQPIEPLCLSFDEALLDAAGVDGVHIHG